MSILISQTTAKTINPVIMSLVQAKALPASEAKAVNRILSQATSQKPAKEKPDKPKLLTTKQTAERLGVCTKTILRMRQNGEITGVNLTGSPKSLRFPESEIDKLMMV